MPLLSLWASNPAAVAQLSIDQVVSTAGQGVLLDGSECSHELREYLRQIPSEKLDAYISQCLASKVDKGGMVLQDLVNELGRRLDYEVMNGRYQGVRSAIGFDGLWRSSEGHTLIAEVKTTDAYRISLDTIARYRDQLIERGEIKGPSSILIVVGRQDTGELEAQIRGSRHAWDVRLISAEALLKLIQLKENADASETAPKIRSILVPREYTRLDGMIDVMFTTARDLESAATDAPSESEVANDAEPFLQVGEDSEPTKAGWAFTDAELLQAKRERILESVAAREGKPLVRKSRALYATSDQHTRVALTISKRYNSKVLYWYAYHVPWDRFLSEAERGYLVLGCMDREYALVIPRTVISGLLDSLNTTTRDGTTYWHLHLVEQGGQLNLVRSRGAGLVPLGNYELPLTT